ncbi:hypothetical protein [Flavobacterium sp.]|uniref:hypothetical protein n=1 Tax=Flavobacterium sp. TaxID=239 RepID=UPI00333EFAF8
MENKITFLSSAIADAQELIRFIDTKTTVVITILGAYIVAFFSVLDKIIANYVHYSNGFIFSLLAFLLLLILTILITVRIIKPTNNPIENIKLGRNTNIPTLQFYVSPNDYSKDDFFAFRNSKKFRLSKTLKEYISELDDYQIVASLTFELLKVSYIRNVKTDRFNVLMWFLFFTTMTFFISYFYFSIENHFIQINLKALNNSCCTRK